MCLSLWCTGPRRSKRRCDGGACGCLCSRGIRLHYLVNGIDLATSGIKSREHTEAQAVRCGYGFLIGYGAGPAEQRTHFIVVGGRVGVRNTRRRQHVKRLPVHKDFCPGFEYCFVPLVGAAVEEAAAASWLENCCAELVGRDHECRGEYLWFPHHPENSCQIDREPALFSSVSGSARPNGDMMAACA